MAQTDAGTDPAAGIAAAVEAATVAVLAGIAVPGVGSPGTSVTQHAGMVTVHSTCWDGDCSLRLTRYLHLVPSSL